MSPQPTSESPLVGDGKGVYRIKVVGNCGAGKSTLTRQLSECLGIPFIHLDQVFWKPCTNWEPVTDEEFQNKLRSQLERYHETGWVMDGNYKGKTEWVVEDLVTDVIWLDPPFILAFFRTFRRTIRRILGMEESAQVECRESWTNAFFSRESILLWAITMHSKVRAYYEEAMQRDRTQAERPPHYVRIRGWGSELRGWIERVQLLSKES